MTQSPATAARAVSVARWRCAECPYIGKTEEYDPCFRFEKCKGVASKAEVDKAIEVVRKPAGNLALASQPSEGDAVTNAINALVANRTAQYGPPAEAWKLIASLKALVAPCPDPVARHALDMICVKVARLVRNPTHQDSWADIAGYARGGLQVTTSQGGNER